jgi:hypothetical protein
MSLSRDSDHFPRQTSSPDSGAHDGAYPVTGSDADRDASASSPSDRHSVLAREKERYGGIKWGAAFFGWLTATGTAVILTALLAAGGAAVGVSTGTDAADAKNKAGTIGVIGAIALLLVLIVAYYCGGYVAGRMARFNGMKQGIAVWVWAIILIVLAAVAAAVLGDKFNILDKVGGFPRLPVGGGDVTTGAIIAVVIAVIAALVGAILGGLAGMRFHRNVDKAGLGH